MKSCDIIIPTYNCAKVLPLTLDALERQIIPDGWATRVVISDDGSSDGTVEKLPITNYQLPITVLTSQHTGRAGARNRAIEKSDADVLLFLGADIILRPNAVACHLQWYDKGDQGIKAVLGMVRWDPCINPSPLMEWMMHGGQQNAYDDVIGESVADPSHYFYGAHVSIRREALGEVRFPEEYTEYGWEDLDLGRQLSQRGIKLAVLSNAVGLHHHRYSVQEILNRQWMIGRTMQLYQKRYPSEKLVAPLDTIRRLKIFVYKYSGIQMLTRLLLKRFSEISAPSLFQLVTAAEFWCGFSSKNVLQ